MREWVVCTRAGVPVVRVSTVVERDQWAAFLGVKTEETCLTK